MSKEERKYKAASLVEEWGTISEPFEKTAMTIFLAETTGPILWTKQARNVLPSARGAVCLLSFSLDTTLASMHHFPQAGTIVSCSVKAIF